MERGRFWVLTQAQRADCGVSFIQCNTFWLCRISILFFVFKFVYFLFIWYFLHCICIWRFCFLFFAFYKYYNTKQKILVKIVIFILHKILQTPNRNEKQSTFVQHNTHSINIHKIYYKICIYVIVNVAECMRVYLYVCTCIMAGYLLLSQKHWWGL